MDRKEFLTASGCCALALFGGAAKAAEASAAKPDPDRDFVTAWLTDLFEGLDSELDAEAKVRVMAACGKGCFRRHAFKTDIAKAGKGDIDHLVEAYHKNFEAWRKGDEVHIRFGEVSTVCYCPAAKFHPARAGDLHCECTRATHQAIFETALERPVKVEIVESLRRGGKTCHFVAHVG